MQSRKTPGSKNKRCKSQNRKPKCVVVMMKLCSIFCVVAPSWHRQNMKRDTMLLGGSYIGSCAKNNYGVECSVF